MFFNRNEVGVRQMFRQEGSILGISQGLEASKSWGQLDFDPKFKGCFYFSL
jgi:hypothetical protein